MRICFVRLSALGDIVMMLPFVRTLQKNFPDAQLSWVIGRSFYPIVSELKGVEFIVVDKIRSWKEFTRAREIFRGRSFDILLAMQASLSAHLFYPLIRAKRKVGFSAARSKDLHSLFIKERVAEGPLHTVDLFLQFAHHIGAEEPSFAGEIPLTAEEALVPPREAYYVMHPCSSMRICDWPVDRYIELGKVLYTRYGLKLFVTGAAKDQEISRQIAARVPHAEDLAGKTTLRQMAAILSQAQFVVAPDTGPTHIASAFGRPVFGLYATSSTKLTGPYFSQETVIDKYEEVKRLVGVEGGTLCSPRLYHKDAMQLITTQEVIEKINNFWAPCLS